MKNSFTMEALKSFFNMEISNRTDFTENKIVVAVDDEKEVCILANVFQDGYEKKELTGIESASENSNGFLCHDFGYGKDKEPKDLNRLKLKNLFEVQTYVAEILKEYMLDSDGKNVYFDNGIREEIDIVLC